MWVMIKHHRRLLSTEIEYSRRAAGMFSMVGVRNNRSGGHGCSTIKTKNIAMVRQLRRKEEDRIPKELTE